EEKRGCSFRTVAPRAMRSGAGQAGTAHEIVNSYDERELADIIWRFGEEPASRRIARAIIRARPLGTTLELASVVAAAAGGRGRRIHPATRHLQGLSIAVEDEVDDL